MRKHWYQDPDTLELVEYFPHSKKDRTGPDILGDIEPYKSMIDGTMITSRSQHREHLKQHDCFEVGNDSSLWKGRKPIPDVAPQQRKELIRAQIDAMSHDEFKAAIKRDVDRIKWNSREA